MIHGKVALGGGGRAADSMIDRYLIGLQENADERAAETIGAVVAVVNALAERGIRVAKPIRSSAGNDVESAESDQGLFHVVVFENCRASNLKWRISHRSTRLVNCRGWRDCARN